MKGTIAPNREQFGCPELYRLCVDLKIWKPRTAFFNVSDFENSQLTRSVIQVRSPSRASDFPWRMYPVQRHSWKKSRTLPDSLRILSRRGARHRSTSSRFSIRRVSWLGRLYRPDNISSLVRLITYLYRLVLTVASGWFPTACTERRQRK